MKCSYRCYRFICVPTLQCIIDGSSPRLCWHSIVYLCKIDYHEHEDNIDIFTGKGNYNLRFAMSEKVYEHAFFELKKCSAKLPFLQIFHHAHIFVNLKKWDRCNCYLPHLFTDLSDIVKFNNSTYFLCKRESKVQMQSRYLTASSLIQMVLCT